jgi:hypothetical protein
VLFHERYAPSWNSFSWSTPVAAAVAIRVGECPQGSAATGPSTDAVVTASTSPIPVAGIVGAIQGVILWRVVVGVGIRACTAISAVVIALAG